MRELPVAADLSLAGTPISRIDIIPEFKPAAAGANDPASPWLADLLPDFLSSRLHW
jgi:hypothetical protein